MSDNAKVTPKELSPLASAVATIIAAEKEALTAAAQETLAQDSAAVQKLWDNVPYLLPDDAGLPPVTDDDFFNGTGFNLTTAATTMLAMGQKEESKDKDKVLRFVQAVCKAQGLVKELPGPPQYTWDIRPMLASSSAMAAAMTAAVSAAKPNEARALGTYGRTVQDMTPEMRKAFVVLCEKDLDANLRQAKSPAYYVKHANMLSDGTDGGLKYDAATTTPFGAILAAYKDCGGQKAIREYDRAGKKG